jgi:hypothetical protein
MRIARLDRVFSLAQALLFSLLYGAEFLVRMDVIRRCEAAWWSGVRKFYCLPNGVSNATLVLLFPRFSLAHRVVLGKVSLALRGLRRLDTILPEALIYDRGYLFEHHRTGFLQVKVWGLQLGLPDLFLCGDRGEAAGQLAVARERLLDSTWDTFARMPSTALVAAMLGSRAHFHEAALAASRFSRLGLRVFLLAITGSLALSYCKTRAYYRCVVNFSFEHFLSCPELGGEDCRPHLRAVVEKEDWKVFVSVILGRFEVFFHFFRGGECDQDMIELFEALNEVE